MDLENIVVDITQRNYNTLQTIQYDVDSRYVNIKIVSNGKNVDLTNYMVSIACKKPDGKIIFNETEMVEPKQGLIKFLISEQISVALGEVVCELKIYGKNSSVLTTQYFTINVMQPISSKKIQSSNEFRQLTIAMNEYNKWIDKVEEKYNELEEEYATELSSIKNKVEKINAKVNDKYSVNVKDFGAVGDGVSDDTMALQSALAYDCVEIPSGIYRITDTLSFENKNIFGSNMTHVTILGDIEDENKSILAVGGQSVVRDITVSYPSNRILGNETIGKRVGIRLFGGWRNLPFQTGAGIYNCQVDNCGTGISDGGASVFSANFKDIRISRFTCRGFEMIGTARTGNVYDNIYITNHPFTRNDGTGDSQKAWQGFVLSGEESECTITQLNVEHATLYQAIIIEDVLGLAAGSIHIEGVEHRDDYLGYLQIERAQGKIDNVSFYFTRHKTGTSLIKFGETKKQDTSNDFYSDNVNFEIGTLVCKGLNRPDRATYGYEPNYPVSASTLSGSIQPFYFISRESFSDKYYVTLNRYNWMTYSYGFNDTSKYREFNCNPHGSITFLKKANMSI